MAGFFSRMKERFGGPDYEREAAPPGYVEIEQPASEARGKVVVRPFALEDFEDIKPILDALREGNTISIINIKPLRERDMVELKRAVNKLKKTVDAIQGEVAGFGDDFIVAAPAFATIYKGASQIVSESDEE